MSVDPSRMIEPSAKGWLVTLLPSTKVPLVLPRSVMVATPSAMLIFAWTRDTPGSSSRMSTSLPRPSTHSELGSTISCPLPASAGAGWCLGPAGR